MQLQWVKSRKKTLILNTFYSPTFFKWLWSKWAKHTQTLDWSRDGYCTMKSQHNASRPPPRSLWLPPLRPLTEFLPQQKTTDEAIRADVLSPLSCPRPDKQRRRVPLNGPVMMRHWQRPVCPSGASGCSGEQELHSLPIHSGSLLMFNHRQELTQCFTRPAHLLMVLLVGSNRAGDQNNH